MIYYAFSFFNNIKGNTNNLCFLQYFAKLTFYLQKTQIYCYKFEFVFFKKLIQTNILQRFVRLF